MTAVLEKNTLDLLNDLIENAKDGEYGFEQCAQRVKSPQLKQILQQRAVECGQAAAELQALVVQHGGEAAAGGTVLGALHRGWVSVKDALTGDSDHAVLTECERGEDAALARYREALRSDMPAEVRAIVVRQMAGAQANHDQVKALRDSTAH